MIKKMADPQEFDSIDELFQKTFDSLPDAPSASGWDVPSPKVWEHVQEQIRPPQAGWTTKSILLISGMAIALMLGLYWTLSQPQAPAEKPVPAAPETAVTATAPVTDVTAAAPEAEVTATVPAAQMPESGTRPATRRHRPVSEPSATAVEVPAVSTAAAQHRPAEDQAGRRLPQGSAPLPGSDPNLPNTTIRRQAEALRKAPWAQPLAPLPTPLEAQYVHPVPESLKALVRPERKN